jgi:putative transposase
MTFSRVVPVGGLTWLLAGGQLRQILSRQSLDGKSRNECLSIEWFRSRREAAVLIEAWRNHYDEVRPHSSLQYLTPAEFKQKLRKELQPTVF